MCLFILFISSVQVIYLRTISNYTVLIVRLNGNEKLEEILKEAIVSEAPFQRVLGGTE